MKIICIGDSNTYGYDPRSWSGSRYPENVRWTDRLGDWEVINFGVNGMSVPRDHSFYTDLIIKNDPELVFVMLGSNDLLEGAGAEKTADRMGAFIDAICEAGKPVLLTAPPVMRTGEWVQSTDLIEESRKLGKLYCELADSKGCLFADAGEWGIELTFDGVHFTPEGHSVFAQNMRELLKRFEDMRG